MWPFKTEHRASSIAFTGDATHDIVTAFQQAASGRPIGAVAAVEVAAGYWQRGFMSASVGGHVSLLTPFVMGQIGRSLLKSGQFVAEIELDSDMQVKLLLPESWEISGSYRPASLQYKLFYNQADGTKVSRTMLADQVVDIKYAPHPTKAGYGVGPLQLANLTNDALAAIEQHALEKGREPHGIRLPIPSGTSEENANKFVKAVGKTKGGVYATSETTAGWSAGIDQPKDFKPESFGGDILPGFVAMHDAMEKAILGAAGVPTSLLGQSDGTLAREQYRQFLAVTLQPVAKEVARVLSESLAIEVELTFDELAAADIASKARAFGALVNAGMSVDDAKRTAGL